MKFDFGTNKEPVAELAVKLQDGGVDVRRRADFHLLRILTRVSLPPLLRLDMSAAHFFPYEWAEIGVKQTP
jgi:hypothetical protein